MASRVGSLVLGLGLLATPAAAQLGSELDRPVERGRELLERGEEAPGPDADEEPILPPAPRPRPGTRLPLGDQPQVKARSFAFEGNTVYPDARLAEVAAPYRDRFLTGADLLGLRDELTRLYVESGYVNSGAVLPDQDVTDGDVIYRIVEGRLGELAIENPDGRLHEAFLRARLDTRERGPLRMQDVEAQLQLLLQDDRIRRLDAELGPGAQPGEARLRVAVEEASAWRALLEASNHQSPSIGAERLRVSFGHANVSGFGDVLSGTYGVTEGLDDAELRYELPLDALAHLDPSGVLERSLGESLLRETRLELRYTRSASDVVEDPFDDIDIESKSTTWAVGLSHALWRDLESELRVGLSAEWRESRTRLLDRRFSFSPGAENGKTQVAVLRFSQEWTRRDRSQALAVRSSFSWGLDAFGATEHGGSTEDGQFLAWLGQFQWARRFDEVFGIERLSGTQTIFRVDLQLSSDPLLPLEQFSLGGANSVRGYRENQLVRDMGWVTSLEARVPLWSSADGRMRVQLAPFVDVGRAWNTKRRTPKPKTLSSAGLGLRFAFGDRLSAEIYWGEELRDVDEPRDRDLQDTGVHFRVRLAVF